jgi:hypothetical protein
VRGKPTGTGILPLLSEEGSPKGGVVRNKCSNLATTPSARAKEASQHLINRAATPPRRGGEEARQRGAATVYFILLTLLGLALLVMATDFGRLYLIQGELQAAADAAALAAATRLVGTTDSLIQADDQVRAAFNSDTGNDNRFNLRLNQIGVSDGSSLVWSYFDSLENARANSSPSENGGIVWGIPHTRYVRVDITGQAPVLFAPFLAPDAVSFPSIAVSAVAGISVPVCSACGIDGLAVQAIDITDTQNYGFVAGSFYTLYLTQMQSGLPGAAPAMLLGLPAAPYILLDHVPAGLPDLDLDSSLFQLAAAGISSAAELDPPGTISIEAIETGYGDLTGNVRPLGQNILCGLNVRFGVDPTVNPNICGAFTDLATELAGLFSADSDAGAGGAEYASGPGLQDYATEYAGNARRVLTMAVVDAPDTMNVQVLNFRQFLIVMDNNVTGLNPARANGAFRAQYLGAVVPLRCGRVGGCTASPGIGRVVLH